LILDARCWIWIRDESKHQVSCIQHLAGQRVKVMSEKANGFNPPEADKGLIPRLLRH